MKKFAQIENNKIHYIMECDVLPPFHSSIEFVEVTGLSPSPEEDWLYDRSNGTFVRTTIAIVLANKTNETKNLASSKILDLVSDWNTENHAEKQRNVLGRQARLLFKKVKSTITTDEEDELDYLDVLWDTIDLIKDASNSIADELEALETIEDIEAYDVTSTNILWP